MSTHEIEVTSVKDPKISSVRQCIESGDWENSPKEFLCVKNKLCVIGKLLLRDHRIVIPDSLRAQVLKLAHEGHMGIVKTKQRLRSKVWWPGIDKEAEKVCNVMDVS